MSKTPTYRDLLNSIPEERLDDHVTLYDEYTGEFCPALNIGVSGDKMKWGQSDVLDEGHVFIVKTS